MKTQILKLKIAAVMFLIAATGCGNGETAKTGPGRPLLENQNFDRVPIEEAKGYIREYRNFCDAVFGKDAESAVRSFTISGEELSCLLGFDTSTCQVDAVRAYIGIKCSTDSARPSDFHLYLTCVSQNGTDSLSSFSDTGRKFVYDLIAPCPKTCDYSSVLYKAFDSVSTNNVKNFNK